MTSFTAYIVGRRMVRSYKILQLDSFCNITYTHNIGSSQEHFLQVSGLVTTFETQERR
jgi:hypothetical protein